MAFRASAEREVLLRQEEEYEAEAAELENRVETLDVSADSELRIQGLCLERDRLTREIAELTERRDHALAKQAQRVDLLRNFEREANPIVLMILLFVGGLLAIANLLSWLLK